MLVAQLLHTAMSSPLSHRVDQLIPACTLNWASCHACCRYTILSHLAMKLERDLWGLLDGPWDGPEAAAFRRSWSQQVRHPAEEESSDVHYRTGACGT